MSTRRFVIALALTAAVAVGLQPVTVAQPSTVTIENPWTRATAPGQAVAGGFMTVINTTSTEDRLLRASSPVAKEVQIHNTTMDEGVMRMRPMADGVAIPAGGRVEFKPRALHLMFMGLQAPIAAGTTVPVTLEFERAGKVGATFRVEAVAAAPAAPAKPATGHHHH
ncbi:MAG: copper chaperone PCu(A)C [Gammaproteobacteria bacterium]|jgi:copper(I)-binding protein